MSIGSLRTMNLIQHIFYAIQALYFDYKGGPPLIQGFTQNPLEGGGMSW